MTDSTELVMEGLSRESSFRRSRHLLSGKEYFRLRYRPVLEYRGFREW